MIVPKATMPGIAEAAHTRGNTMSALNTIAVASLLLGLQVTVAVADDPPKFDLAPTCNAAVRFAIVAGRDKEACIAGWGKVKLGRIVCNRNGDL